MIPKTDTKTVDNKGRLLLGERFANRVVIIQEVDDTEVTVTLAKVIPQREVWLFENAAAKAAVFEGIEQARKMQFADAPDMGEAEALAESIPDATEGEDGVQAKVDPKGGRRVRATQKRRTVVPHRTPELAQA